MVIDTKGIAQGIVDAAYRTPAGRISVDIDIGDWTAKQVQELVDAIDAERQDYGLRIKGIATDSSGFNKLGAEPDGTLNGGRYGDIVVARGDVPFDSFKIVIEKVAK